MVCSIFTSAAPGTPCRMRAMAAAVCCMSRKAVAVDFHGDIASHPGDELVKAHLNRLRKLVVISRKLSQGPLPSVQPGRFWAPRGSATRRGV